MHQTAEMIILSSAHFKCVHVHFIDVWDTATYISQQRIYHLLFISLVVCYKTLTPH